MNNQRPPSADEDADAGVMCLQRLATGLCGYPDLKVTVRLEDSAPCLTVRNAAISYMSETVTVTRTGSGLAFIWSWGARIADASDPDSAACAVAYVLAADGVRLGR